MPSKLFALNDQGFHTVPYTNTTGFQELVQLDIDQGPYLVMATGTLEAISLPSRIVIRLEVHGTLHPNLGTHETTFMAPSAPVYATLESFALMVSANIPKPLWVPPVTGESFSATPPRAVLSARCETWGGAFMVTNIRIVAFAFDEIVATTIPPAPSPSGGETGGG